MRYNQFSYIETNPQTMLIELRQLGFDLSTKLADKVNFEQFIRKTFFNYSDTDYPLSNLLATQELDLLNFFQSDAPLTKEIFDQVALQLLGFVPGVDYQDLGQFVQEIQFPVPFGNIIANCYQLLNCRQKSGNTLIDSLVAQGLIPQDNRYHFFNGKALSTFTTHDLIREVVYVDSGLDTDGDGLTDLVKVNIVRPRFDGQVPAIITNSPYQQGVNEPASDKSLYQMQGQLKEKTPHEIHISDEQDISLLSQASQAELVAQAEETFTYQGRFTTLNDYLLSRGFANIYVSGIGTLGSDGLMTSGDYRQIQSFKAVIDWLYGRATAFTSHRRDKQLLALWANGKVATTGLSYLGTISTGLATTGVDGLEVIIAEAGISSWYDYYRENGLVVSPGGYPGEDLDSLAQLTYSKSLQAGDFLKTKDLHQAFMADLTKGLDRESGDYNQFWHQRNYLPQLHKIRAEVVYTHGLQDWNVKPIHVYNVFRNLLPQVKKHLFLHLGEHVYMNNWQSIDFRESMNALLCQRLLGWDNDYQLAEFIWQDNSASQTWLSLPQFGSSEQVNLDLGQGQETIQNHYAPETFDRYSKNFQSFKEDLFMDRANQITVDLPVNQNLLVNGHIQLNLRLKSSHTVGLISAQLLDFGTAQRIGSLPSIINPRSMDCGRHFVLDNLCELPRTESSYRLLTKGHLNLQNREGLLTISPIEVDQWMTCHLKLQPTIYRLKKGDTLRLVLYTTDFEHTIRDNSQRSLTVDLSESSITLPILTDSDHD